MTKLNHLSVAAALDGLANKDFSSADLTGACLSAMEETRDLNAFVAETADLALEHAKASDARRAAGDAGLMEGIPLGIKDLFCTEGTETTAGSKILKGFVPPYESTVTANLKAAGTVMLGKLNMDEFAMGSANLNPHFGTVRNPWTSVSDPDARLVAGGSSGGSAAAVAARACLAATGTDTGGSIRQPGSFAGIVGLKPTYGRCSRWGVVAFASSLDQAGPMTRSVEDAAIMLQAMAGYDAKDSTCADIPVPDYRAEMKGNVKGLVIGVPKEYQVDGMPAEINALWQQGIDWLKAQGAEIRDISLPHTKYALPAYYIVAPAEASSNLARYDGVRYGQRVEAESLDEMYARTRGEGFGAEVRRRIMIGTYVLSAGYYDAYYNQARRVRTLIADDFKKVYADGVDAILTPATPSAAFAADKAPSDPVTMYLNDVFTVPVNMAGLPGISVPAGLSADRLPLGLQIIGKPFGESELLKVAAAVEEAADFTATPALMG